MFDNLKSQLKENIWDNEQVLQIRQKFSELDREKQSYILLGSFAFFLSLLLGSLLYLGISNASLSAQIADDEESIHYLQKSSEKMEEIRAAIRNQTADPNFRDLDRNTSLTNFTEKVTQKAFVPKDSYEIGAEKQNSVQKGIQESSLELKVNKISLRQLVKMLYFFEQSHSGIDVQKLTIDEKDDTSGYLWASLSLHRITENKKLGH